MAATIPTYEPESVVAGDTIEWTKTLGDYPPSDGWTLKYRLIGSDVDVSVTASEDGETYEIEIAVSSLVAVVTEKTVRMIGWVENDGATERHTIYDAALLIHPNVATASAANLETHAVTTLAIIEAAIEGRLTADMESYSIDGRQVTKIPIEQLLKLRGVYRTKVWREQNPGRSYPAHAVRFGHAS